MCGTVPVYFLPLLQALLELLEVNLSISPHGLYFLSSCNCE